MKIKKGDSVILITGKDRGKTGKVLRVSPREGRVIVEGLALATRHRRPRKGGEKGQRITMPVPIAASNVKILCGACGKPTRIGFRNADDVKQRICKKCGAPMR